MDGSSGTEFRAVAGITLGGKRIKPLSTASSATGPDTGMDYLADFRETWNEATRCTLSAPVDDPDGGWVGRLRMSLKAYERLSERLSRGFDWLHDHDESDPAWAKNQALYDKLHWRREMAWQRAVGASNELSIAVWRLWVNWSHMRTLERGQTGFDVVEGPGDIWERLMPNHRYEGEWPPNPSEGWWNEKPRAGKD